VGFLGKIILKPKKRTKKKTHQTEKKKGPKEEVGQLYCSSCQKKGRNLQRIKKDKEHWMKSDSWNG